MVDVKKFLNMDLYGLLGIEMAAQEADIRKAYRRKALECHPDKNPDNPKAAELFHELSKALEVLLDQAARQQYDRVILARQAAEIRNRQLDSKRQKVKADLEARERAAAQEAAGKSTDSEAEIERLLAVLRADASRILENEQAILRKQLIEERQKKKAWKSAHYRIRIRWKTGKSADGESGNGGYTESNLRRFLQKYGDLEAFVMSKQKRGSAMVEFRTQDAAEMAVAYEKGLLENPLTLRWIGEEPPIRNGPGPSPLSNAEFESIVLRHLRQAEERKTIIAQMEKDDADDSVNGPH